MKKVLTSMIALALVVSFSFMAMPKNADATVWTEELITLSINSKPVQERTFVLSQDFTGWFTHSPVASYGILVIEAAGADRNIDVWYWPERINDMPVLEYFTVKPNAKTYLNITAFGFDLTGTNFFLPHLGSINYKAEFSYAQALGGGVGARTDFPAITIPYAGGGVFGIGFYYVAAYLSDTNRDLWGDRITSRIYFDLN